MTTTAHLVPWRWLASAPLPSAVLLAAFVHAAPQQDQPAAAPEDEGVFKQAIEEQRRGPQYRLEAVPPLAIDSARWRPSPQEEGRIKALIASLTDLTEEQRSPRWMGGSAFTTLAGPHVWGAPFRLPAHQVPMPAAVTELVAAGPQAIPALLDALDDATPTKTVIDGTNGVGVLFFGTEVEFNTTVAREAAAREAHPDLVPPGGGTIGRERGGNHVVTRGDVCFTILGQIVNRRFVACSQPGRCWVVNSPTHDPAIAAAVRAAWCSEDPARTLFESLLADLHTRGGGMWSADGLQCGAATRLLSYFPEQAVPLIVARLDGFDVARVPPGAPDAQERWQQIAATNAVTVTSFIQAVSFSRDPDVRAAVLRVIERTDDPNLLAESLTDELAAAAPDMILGRLNAMMAAAPPLDPEKPWGPEVRVLRTAAEYFPERARPLFDRYVAHGTTHARSRAVSALAHPRQAIPWAVEFLAPMLDDTAETGMQYGPAYDRKPLRLCDRAAEALAQHVPGATFTLAGEHASLDRQITNLKRFIAGEALVLDAGKAAAAEAPSIEPLRVLTIPEPIGQLYDSSSARLIFAGRGHAAADGWDFQTLYIDATRGDIIAAVTMSTRSSPCGPGILWSGRGSAVVSVESSERGNDFVRRDVYTGAETGRVASPFDHEFASEGPMAVDGMGDLIGSYDQRRVHAITGDGTFHTIDLATGEHALPWKHAGKPTFEEIGFQASVISVAGRNQVLLEFWAMDEPPRLWDQDSGTMTELLKVPFGGWRAAWGNLALNAMNNRFELWDLASRQRVQLPELADKVVDVICDPGGTRAFARLADHTIAVIDVRDRAAARLLARLAAPDPGPDRHITLTLSDDGGILFFVACLWPRSADPDQAEPEPAPQTTIALFDVAALTAD